MQVQDVEDLVLHKGKRGRQVGQEYLFDFSQEWERPLGYMLEYNWPKGWREQERCVQAGVGKKNQTQIGVNACVITSDRERK